MSNDSSVRDDVRNKVIARFGANAQKYVTSEFHAHGNDLQRIVEHLAVQPHEAVLDIATGGGHVAHALAPQARHVVASDVTPRMLDAARAHGLEKGLTNITYVLADAQDLPFLDESFDVVTCRIAPHHFADPGRFVREVGRVLSKGGRFAIADNIVPEDEPAANFINDLEKLRDDSHVRCAAVSEWRLWLSAAGLTADSPHVFVKTINIEDWASRQDVAANIMEEITRRLAEPPAAYTSELKIEWRDERPRSMQILEAIFVGAKSYRA
ncbi:MAG: methyltransferase domain-containing protein [Firmicutes bacterium]|nr:methyltransferase domain-containing protein [Bacillota bacterium]